jgi:peptidoglycan/LPS O-acetylase OafA/YrhL
VVVTQLTSRVYGLDILRAAAILFVVYGHGGELIRTPGVLPYYHIPYFDGVQIFFVLSGFLIGGILIRTIDRAGFSGRELADFWVRRWFRTLPNYYLVLSLVVVLALLAGKPLPPDLHLFFLFSQNLNYPHPPFFEEAWSLAVEEWFYLLIPILLLVLIRVCDRRRAVLIGIVGVIVAVTSWRVLKAASIDGLTLQLWHAALPTSA